MWATKPYRDAVAIQKVIMLRIESGEVDDKTLAALARAMCDLEESKRKLKMKPLPKSVDVSKHVSRGRSAQITPNFTE